MTPKPTTAIDPNHVAYVRISWPSRPLWANDRSPRWQQAQAVKAYRREAWAASMLAGVKKLREVRPMLTFNFYPPDRKSRDMQSMPHTQKAAVDGVQDALGINDAKFLYRYPDFFAGPVKGGCVLIEVKACPQVVDMPHTGFVE